MKLSSLRLLLGAALLILAGSRIARGQEPDDSALGREVEMIVRRLASDDFETRLGAFEELELLGRRALPYLEPALESDDPEVARLILRHVTGLRRRAEKDLLAALDTQTDGFAESQALERIVARGREVLPALYRVLDEEDAYYPSYSYYRMRNAYTAIGRLVGEGDLDRLFTRLSHPNSQHQYLLRPILEGMDRERVFAKVLKVLADPEADPQARSQLMAMCWNTSFSGNDERIPRVARGLLDDEAPLVRTAALRFFGIRREDDVLPALLSRCKDEDADVRAAAIRAIRSYRTPEVSAALKSALRDPEAVVRAAALETMRDTAGPDLAPLIRPFLKDPDPIVRSNAAQTLGRFGDRSALPTLLELLSHRDTEFLTRTLHSVVDAVGRIGDPAALTPLWELLEDSSEVRQLWNYRYLILSSIVRVGGEGVLDRVRGHLEDPELQNRYMVLDAVVGIDSKKVVPILLHALENGDTRLRTAAVRGLSARMYEAAAPLIAKALGQETDPWFLSEAVKALTAFGHREAVPRMRKLLAESEISDSRLTSLFYALMKAMMRFKVGEAAPRIAELTESSESYRYIGVDVLGRLGNKAAVPLLMNLLLAESNGSFKHRVSLALARLGEPSSLLERIAGMGVGDSSRVEALIALGRLAEARKIVEETVAANPENGTELYNLACICSLMGEKDRAFELLMKAFEFRTFQRQQLHSDPDLDPIRDDPRFKKVIEKGR